MTGIVQVNVSQTQAPTPNFLQETGALISQGATSLQAGTYGLLTQSGDENALLNPALALSGLVWSGGTVLATAASVIPGQSIGDTFITTQAGNAPAGYNGTVLATVTSPTTYTYNLVTNPGNATVLGTYTPPGQSEFVSMAETFFEQGTGQAVYVLELGPVDQVSGPPALETFIQNNPGMFYSYLVPRSWDATSGLLALIAANEALTAKTYFFVTTTLGTYQAYTTQMKCVVWGIEAPGIPLTEFSMAEPYCVALSYAPTSVNRMTPLNLSYLYGVTPYPLAGNSVVLAQIKAAFGTVVGTGAEGGISTATIVGGKTADGRDFSYWYSADWMQINGKQALANTVINGSNDPLNPLYYDQSGIDRLQDTAVNQAKNAITYGLATGTVIRTALDPQTFRTNFDDGVYAGQNVVNAVPFSVYVGANPSSYKTGVYGGLSCVYIPARGFEQVIFDLDVTDLLTQ